MRKILLFIFPLLFSVFLLNAQSNNAEDNAALQLVSANKAPLGLSAAELSNVTVSRTYLDNASGIRMVYLQQTYKGIPIYNQMLVLAFKNNRLISNAGTFNHSMEKLANSKTALPSVSAEAAVQSALSDKNLVASQMAIAISRKDNGNKVEFSNMGVTRENITAQLMWVPIEETVNNVTSLTKMKLGWQVYFIPKTTSDYWLVRVDATDNSILNFSNLTVYDNWGRPELPGETDINYPEFAKDPAVKNVAGNNPFDFQKINSLTDETTGPSIVNSATYRVIPFPAESPIHPGGTAATRTDPWTAAPGNATTLKWHTGTAGANYTHTRGNNVWAYQDQANANAGSIAASASSTTTPDPLTFDFVPNFTVAPTQTTPVQNQQFNITNLFYWNNVIHDVMYIYGFNEASANFQDDNMGRGGLGNDHVNAEAQDGSGTNNANFATPADGGSGRMQMYLWTLSSPQRDGDVDNGIITHEHGHGISNRLTGGGTGSCLGNAEQMGEGWSDYYCLMFTQDWATATLNTGFNSPRGIGTYALNQPITGVGIRSQRYCTDFTVNNKVYAATIPAAPHDRGEIWCATLWDMTWNIINQVGSINGNLYDLAGGGGNNIAMKLVTEGLKLQQCNPGFISGRNAILQADQNLYGGQYSCAIWEAFRRRGMGAFASEGSTSSVTDQIADFTPPITLTVTPSVTTVAEGQNITYTNTITTCSAITGYTLRDTLPANANWVSGGTYDPIDRVVSFPVAQGAGATNYVFTVNVPVGSYFPPVTLLNEPVAGTGIPAGWTATSLLGPSTWVSTTAQSHSAPNSMFGVDNATATTDFTLATTAPIALGAPSGVLTFWHNYDTEAAWDGGVVEISTNGGTSWIDLGPNMTINGYNGAFDPNPLGTNPLKGRPGFTGNSGGWIQTTVNLLPYANQNALIRFRMTSDDNTAATGWYVDDVLLNRIAQVNMRTSLFNPANVRVSFKNIYTPITPLILCSPNIVTQPTSTTVCANSSASFTCVATATGGVTYQWQVSTNGGGLYTDIPGATASTYTFTAALAQNGNLFRCVVTGSCNPTATSTAATLTVAAATIGGTLSPANIPVCGVTNGGTFTLTGHNGAILQWEMSTNGGGTWTTIANTGNQLTFTNATTTTLYRVLVQVSGCTAVYSTVGTVVFTASSPLVIISDVPTTLCQGDPALLTVVGLTSTPFTSTTAITVPGTGTGAATGAPANPYPSTLAVAGLPTTGVTVKSVTLSNIFHTFPSDMDIALVSPTGQVVMLMSDAGGGTDLTGQTYTFDDAATASLTAALNATGTYKPTDLGGVVDPFPGGPTTGTTSLPLSTFTGNPNGNWQLYIVDDAVGDIGTISGFSITFNATGIVPGLTYTWTPTTGLNQSTGNPVAASPATTTTYTVMADNGAGCVRQASITLNVNARPAVTSQPANLTVCSGLPATFTVGATGAGISYQWQVSTNGGGLYTNLANATPYSGVSTATLTINPTTTAMNSYRYRCVISGICTPNAISNGGILSVTALPTVTVTPASTCGGVAGINGTLLTASGANTYTWAPIAGLYSDATAQTAYVANTQTPTVYAAPTAFTAYTVSGRNATTGCIGTAIALVNYTPPAPTITPASVLMCLGDPAVKLKSSSATSTTVNFGSGTINLAVPDNTAAGVSSNISVPVLPAGATIASIAVRLNMSHTYPGDMIFNLKGPNGQVLNLYKYAGGAFTGPASGVPTWGWYNASVSSTGTTAFNSVAVAPFIYGATPTWRPDALNATVAGVTVQNPNGFVSNAATFTDLYTTTPTGTWTLAMADGGGGDVGTLASWSLEITYVQGVPATPAVWTPVTGLFSDASASTPYVAGTAVDSVWARPTPSGVYPYVATVKSLPPTPSTVTMTNTATTFFTTLTFNVRNNNNYAVTLTNISSMCNLTGATDVAAYYKTSAVNGLPGAITTANGWNLAGSATITSVGFPNVQPFLSNLSIVIPPNSTYGILVSALLGATPNLVFSNAGTNLIATNAGVDIITGAGIGYAGPVVPGAPTFTPYYFIGSVSVVPSVPACTSPGKTVIVTVNEPIAFTTQPTDVAVCTDKVATFTATATGSSIAHNWKVSTNNGNTWSPIANGGVYSGAQTGTLTITAPPVSMSGYLYKDSVSTTPCAPKSSNVVRLTVNPLPTVVIAASPYTRLFPGLKTTIFSTVTPAASSYTWLKNGVVVPNASASSILVDVDGLGDYTLRVNDVNGCTNTSNLISLKDSASGRVFIYPTPNGGQFQVRYYSIINNTNLPRGINVYDARGKRVVVQNYSISAPYARMDVDLRKYGTGVYWVEVVDVAGNRLAVGRTEVLR